MRFLFTRLLNRSNLLKAHLYLALSVGLFFSLIGLSGSLSIYRADIDLLLNPELIITNPHGNYQTLDKIYAAVKAAHPHKTGSWTLEMPQSPNGMITAWFEKPSETFFQLYAPLMVSVNPYTAEVVSSRFWGNTFTTWLLNIHTQLNMGNFGWGLVGMLGIALLSSCLTGLYLWWPSFNTIKEILKFRPHNGIMLLAFDIHRWLGLLSSITLIVLACTGFLLSYPSILETFSGSSGMEHGQTGRTIISTAIPNNHPTGLSAATFVAQGPFPKAQLRRVTTPAGDTGVYKINLRQNSEVNHRHPYTTVWVDQWSGQIKEVRNPTLFSRGEIFASWIWPLHTGEALGASGRLIWFLSGISVFLLYVTGILRWLCKTGKLRDRKIQYANLTRLNTKIKTQSVNFINRLYTYSINLIEKITPYLSQIVVDILKTLKNIIINHTLHVIKGMQGKK